MSRFEREFNKVLQEDMMSADVVGGSERLEGGSVGNTDSHATDDQRVYKSIFGGTQTRGGITKCKKCKKDKKCKECEDKEKETK